MLPTTLTLIRELERQRDQATALAQSYRLELESLHSGAPEPQTSPFWVGLFFTVAFVIVLVVGGLYATR